MDIIENIRIILERIATNTLAFYSKEKKKFFQISNRNLRTKIELQNEEVMT